ncbi:MAG: hypothetical protein RL701_7279 [Pseudomonadota bacterium]
MKRSGLFWACCLSACAASPARPYVPLAEHWLFSPPSAATTAPDAASAVAHAPLWERFQCPELQSLLAQALSESYEQKASAARASQQAALARVARAPLYPALALELSLLAQSANSRSLGSVSGGFFDAGLRAAYDVDVWGKNKQHAWAEDLRTQASRYDLAATELNIASGVASTYFEILSLRERNLRAQQNLAATQRVLSVVEARARAGTALAREVAEQRALVATQSAYVELLAQAEAEALVTLAITAGREPGAVQVRAEGLDVVTDPTLTAADLAVPARLSERRPDVARAEAELRATHADVTAARAALWPQLNLAGSVAFQTGFLADVPEANGNGLVYTGILSLSQPIFDAGALAGVRDAAAARRAEAEANYRRVVLQAVGEVDRALRALVGLQKRYDLQRQVIDEARRAFTLVEVEYQAGATDLLAVLDAQRALFRAEDDYGVVRLEKLRAEVALVTGLGGGWSERTPRGHVPVNKLN